MEHEHNPSLTQVYCLSTDYIPQSRTGIQHLDPPNTSSSLPNIENSILFFPFLLTISTTTPSNQKWNNSNYIWNLNREAGGFAMIWHGNKHLVWSSTSTPSPTTPFPHRMASLRLEDFVIPSKGPHITSMEPPVLTLTEMRAAQRYIWVSLLLNKKPRC